MVKQKPDTNTEKEKNQADKLGTDKAKAEKPTEKPKEIGGPAGPEPTRYGDWEVGGRCSDF